ncbi:MAG: aspartate aminotransferase family protein [Gemmatimonadales bacterium]
MAYRYPETAVLYRKLNRSFPRIVRGQGSRLYDQDGKEYLDGSGGAYVANLGHGVSEIVEGVVDQIRRVAYVSGMAFTNDAVEDLATELVPLMPPGLDKFFFLTSGSDAVEAALKLARQYWVDSGRPGKHKILCFAPGYHGNTMLALSASAREHYRKTFAPWLTPVVQLPAPYAYRCRCDGSPQCPRCTGRQLEDYIEREGADSIAVLIGEPVGGSSTGASVPRPEYWRTIREICTRHEILWIADEVLAGAGRTGTWTAVEQYRAVPDILTMGKGISGGYASLAAVATSTAVLAPVAARSGGLIHQQTFTHTPMMCAAGLAAVRYIKQHDLLARCRTMGARLHAGLEAFRDHPLVGDVRGRGLLAGIEFVEDKATRAPFDRARKVAETFTDLAQEGGLVVWPNVGQADGTNGDLVCLAPPFVVTDEELGEMLRRFGAALDATWARVGGGRD